jgi:hypothetical protein
MTRKINMFSHPTPPKKNPSNPFFFCLNHVFKVQLKAKLLEVACKTYQIYFGIRRGKKILFLRQSIDGCYKVSLTRTQKQLLTQSWHQSGKEGVLQIDYHIALLQMVSHRLDPPGSSTS